MIFQVVVYVGLNVFEYPLTLFIYDTTINKTKQMQVYPYLLKMHAIFSRFSKV